MSDIVERLRICAKFDPDQAEAADEIEKLRAAVQDLAKHIWRGDWDKLKPETRAALGEKK
tara:strand:+ start:7683 stop:7862 length:180 start_codon:yes stop_codon:yes gene_type:complete